MYVTRRKREREREREREKIRESRKDFILELVVEQYALEGFVAIRNETFFLHRTLLKFLFETRTLSDEHTIFNSFLLRCLTYIVKQKEKPEK